MLWPKCVGDPSIGATTTLEVQKSQVNVMTERSIVQNLLNRGSSWDKILRIGVYCLKWKSPMKVNPCVCELTPGELNEVKAVIVRPVQQVVFQEVITALTKPRGLVKPYRPLDLFIDSVGLVRVGSRIREAQKHPVLSPKRHRVTDLIVDAYYA